MSTDALGNLVTLPEPDPANQPNGTLVTNYKYDVLGRLYEVRMPRDGVTQTRSFECLGWTSKPTKTVFPENGTTTYTYNPDLLLASKVDNKGQKLTYGYDPSYRATTIHKYPAGSTDEDACEQIVLQWDEAAAAPADWQYAPPSLYGRLGSAVHGARNCQAGQTIEAFRYDTAGRMTGKAMQINFETFDGSWMTTCISYNRVGATSYSDPSYTRGGLTDDYQFVNEFVKGAIYTIGYDSLMRPVSLTDDQHHSFVSSVNYNPASQITQISAPEYSTAYQYNERNQLVGIGSSTGFSETYAFSPTQNNAQILSQTDTRTGER